MGWKLSKGYIWKIIGLQLSIVFFNLLGLLAFGIGLLFALPASIVIMLHFYNQVLELNKHDNSKLDNNK
ncbi:MAG: hypothetical protein ACMXYL_02240 [Candidatus Woesearchaeota archaeon]